MDLRKYEGFCEIFCEGLCVQLAMKLFCLETLMVYGMNTLGANEKCPDFPGQLCTGLHTMGP